VDVIKSRMLFMIMPVITFSVAYVGVTAYYLIKDIIFATLSRGEHSD
jgi:hypothetical protein